MDVSESESHSVMPDSLRPHGLYSPWNSPGQNIGVGSQSSLSPGDLPNSGNKPRSSTLQADSLPADPKGESWTMKKAEHQRIGTLNCVIVEDS